MEMALHSPIINCELRYVNPQFIAPVHPLRYHQPMDDGVAAAIEAFRQRTGMSYQQMGEKLLVSANAVHKWARGGAISEKNLVNVAALLGCAPHTLRYGQPQGPAGEVSGCIDPAMLQAYLAAEDWLRDLIRAALRLPPSGGPGRSSTLPPATANAEPQTTSPDLPPPGVEMRVFRSAADVAPEYMAIYGTEVRDARLRRAKEKHRRAQAGKHSAETPRDASADEESGTGGAS